MIWPAVIDDCGSLAGFGMTRMARNTVEPIVSSRIEATAIPTTNSTVV